SPRRIQCAPRRDTANQLAAGVKRVHEPMTHAGHVVLLLVVLQRVGDGDDAADVLYSERRVAVGNAAIDESAWGKLHEVMVEDVDRAGAEIGGVKKIAGNIAGDRAGDGEAFVDVGIGGR